MLQNDNAIVFHKVHGSNVRLTDLALNSAQRINPEDNSNGLLFTSRRLRPGEGVELRLEAVSSILRSGGLEIGVTDLDPSTLTPDALPRTVTELGGGDEGGGGGVGGRTVALSGDVVAYNGRALETVARSTHDIVVHQTLGLRLDGEWVEMLVCGESVTRINVSRWQHVFGVIDLYGKAEAVNITVKAPTLQSSTKLEETKMTIRGMLEKMMLRNIGDIQSLRVYVKVVEESYHKFLKERPAKQHAAEYLAELQGGIIVTDYLKQLEEWGTEDKVISGMYIDLRNMCLNYAYSSPELCKQFGDAGLLEMCTRDLRTMQRTYKCSEVSVMRVQTALGIVQNCARGCGENRERLRGAGFVAAARAYSGTDSNARPVVLAAVMAIATVMHPAEASVARLSEATMSAMLERLQRAIGKEVNKYDGWQAYELCLGLANLAADEVNLKNAVQLSAHCLFAQLVVSAKDDQDTLAGLQALQAHICPNSCRVIAATSGLLHLLQATQQQGSVVVREKAKEVYEFLVSMVEKRNQEKGRKTERVSGAGGGGGGARGGAIHQRAPDTVEELPGGGGGMDGMGEVVARPLGARTKCPYQLLCQAFFNTLSLTPEFFNPRYDMCYCKKCHRERKDQDYYHRGSPPKQYGLPIGWCRFALLLPPRARALDVSNKWHRAYHGTRHKFLSKIIEVGELAVPGRDTLGGHRIRELPGHFCDGYKPEGFNTKNIFLSPSIHYSGHDAYAAPLGWRYQGKRYLTRVAFQVFISPDSYQVGAETIGAKKQLDPKFSNSKIEWFTSQQGSTILYGLLLKLEEK